MVTDEGPGVPPGERERIWERFWRGEAARSAGVTGTGIGLATVRDLVSLHGGSCGVESAAPWGARFVVRIPEGT
jgi:signal transduction histidine kinase